MNTSKGAAMKPLVLVLSAACLALVVAACGGGGAQSAGPVPSVPVEAASAGAPTFELWFIGDSHGPCCRVGSTARTAEELGIPHLGTDFAIGPHVFEKLVEALLAGPSPREAALGFGSPFEETGIRLLGVSLENGIVTVDLSSEFRARKEGFVGLPGLFALASVVYTVTQFPEIGGVHFKVEGRPVQVPPGKDPSLSPIPPGGVIPETEQLLDRPVTREDYENAIAATTVKAPVIGSEVASPARIAGTATLIEGRVTALVLGAGGTVLAERVVSVTCGTRCRSDYEIEIPFEVSERQSGVIQLRTQRQPRKCPPGAPACQLLWPAIPVTLVP
jgi:sporulation and spore germination protein/immunoglobulin-like protein involved in spore germination